MTCAGSSTKRRPRDSCRRTPDAGSLEHRAASRKDLRELRPHLLVVFEEAESGTEYIITGYRGTNANLRTQLCRIIKRAGLQPWSKLFHNLRATRQTELEEEFPSHVVCAWIGDSQAVAARHYLQVTDDHFARAVQSPVQQPAADTRNESHESGSMGTQRANAKSFNRKGL
jgi:hypothetical protein